jgi:hypothetical protein
MNRVLVSAALVFVVSFLGASSVLAQAETPLFKKYSGRVPILALRGDYPNPASLVPENEDCANGVDDDADGAIDYADTDCQGGLGPQNLILKLPFDVVQPVGTFPAARYTGIDKTGEGGGELLINTTGPGGRKLSYLRTSGVNLYKDVTVRATVLPGGSGDQGGPVAIRIQATDAGAKANMSYYVSMVPGAEVSIRKDLGNGNSATLASATSWASGAPIDIVSFAPGSPCYMVEFSAVGSALTATVSEVDCVGVLKNIFDVVNGHTVTMTASDGDLAEGYVGVRSDNDAGGGLVDDAASALADPSIVDYFIIDPLDDARPKAPRIAFFNSFSSQIDKDLDYTTTPITARDGNVYNRSITTVADASLATYLRSLGFQVDEFHISSFALGLITPDDINSGYDLFWLPSSGGSADTRTFARGITIPFIFAEHVDGSSSFAGLWAGTGELNGNEGQVACGNAVFTAIINGANEAPNPVDTPATGFGTFPYDPATKTLSFHIEYSGLSSAETAAHFHNAPVGTPGGVMKALPPGNPKIGSVVLDEAQEAELLAGNVYVNIHSSNHGGGEIRGQLVPGTLSPTTIRILPADKGGNPDHPIVRGLADENGDIVIHDSAQFPLNTAYPFPGDAVGLTGAGFKTVKQILDERGWGPGCPETQFAGFPTAAGAAALAGMVNPCTGQTFWQTDDAGTLTSADGKGHIAIVAAEAGTPRVVADPENCPEPCQFESRVVFYWLSDRAFPYATKNTLAIVRRSVLWALRLLDSENRSDVPFMRADSNGDGKLDLSDAVFVFNYLFGGGREPTCIDAADSNDDEKLDISDGVFTLNFLFQGGLPPKSAFHLSYQGCALDLTPAGPDPGKTEDPKTILSCKSYNGCRA